jgi:UDP-N-acetylglucosamine acyltransferase
MSNTIHPTAIVEGDVQLGVGNVIGPYCCLYGPLTIGDDNLIGPHVAIGTPGQDTRNPRYDSSTKPIALGSRNIVREFTGIQKPCYRDITLLGNDIHLMQSVHIPHDAILEDRVVVTPMVAIGGIARIMEGATLSMGCTVHQYSVVGQYCIIATNAPVTKNVRPFSRYIPGKPVSVNRYAVKKFGYEDAANEIEDFVLRGILPKSERLGALVEHYMKHHVDSGREQY